MADITLQSIAHSYASKPSASTDGADYVLHNIELSWRDGGAYALLGPSGCGKTTLLNIMSGLIRPSRGRVCYDDRDVTDLPTRERNIAQVFQFPVIYDTMTVFDNLAFPLRNRGVPEGEVYKRVVHLAEMLELAPVLRRRAVDLTADMKQIISLGRGLVRDDVAAILFDEPLTVIDPHQKWILRRKLREIHKQFQHTLIYVTHDQTEALTFADEVVVMHEGRVLQQGTPQALFSDPAHTYVGYFIGSPGMNFLPCQVRGHSAVVAGHEIALPPALAASAAARSGAIQLGIRPERIALVAADAPGAIPVAVDFVEDHGHFAIVAATMNGHAIKIKLDGDPIAPGATCHIGLPPEHLRLYEDDYLIASAPGHEHGVGS